MSSILHPNGCAPTNLPNRESRHRDRRVIRGGTIPTVFEPLWADEFRLRFFDTIHSRNGDSFASAVACERAILTGFSYCLYCP
jgi:hypothetical protein